MSISHQVKSERLYDFLATSDLKQNYTAVNGGDNSETVPEGVNVFSEESFRI